MKVGNHSFEVFDRNHFVYRVDAEGAEKVKEDYVSAWNEWKRIVETSVLDSGSQSLTVENTEHWQNSGNLRRRFWSRIKNEHLLDKPSCIAAMISNDNLRVYLEWHGYKNEKLVHERNKHNGWIFSIEEWIKEKDINTSEYRIWKNKDADEDFKNYWTLEDLLKDEKLEEDLVNYLDSNHKNWVRIGKVYLKSTILQHENITGEMGSTINELEWLYNRVTGSIKEIVEPDENLRDELVVDGSANKINEPPINFSTNKALIKHIHSYIESNGFLYSIEEVTNLFLSIKTKPFVILSGISGTGKTKIVQWFAESVGATEDNGQFTLIPVRPDWNDSSDLLGYVDIKGDFKTGPLTKVIERAEENPDLPFFVLLDEMNLARVEHYFSDILSVMESCKWQNGKIVTSNLLTKEVAGRDIKLPTNLYIIGTVNMDETTHPFSKKVLDRANTIEFNRVELSNLAFLEGKEEIQPVVVSDSKFRANYLHLKDLYASNKALVESVTAELENINKSLQLINAHVGYRVRDEICFYLDYNENSGLMSPQTAFDHCILQKILPRVSGSDKRVEQLLMELYLLFTGRVYDENQDSYHQEIEQAKYPKSAAKVLEMLRRLKDDGFTSFWIS
ncbi:HI_0552 family protein [Neobacillus sp. WH10]|uniref:HI_0552 family protein n=1 Tax=Neobacillus sp. WH10 TaxID=3047873 RepID=UPI0024C14B19|nr:HI_0552 family protein [Neobacillus sp. WH10]WHY78386.1 HI_0552 family protein [Neobacillus sp. WH10]